MNGGRSTAVALFAAAGLFSGCSASTAPQPGPSLGLGASNSTPASLAISPSSAAPTGTTMPSSGPRSSTPTVADLAVRFPKTKQGAADFVAFLFDAVGHAHNLADPGQVEGLVDPTNCSDCSRWLANPAAMAKDGQRFVGVFWTLQRANALTVQGDTVGVITQFIVPAGKIVDSLGHTVNAREASGPTRADFFLQFRDHWVVVRGEMVR